MTFEVTVLGSNSSVPAYERHPTAQVLNLHEKLFLLDCGEGTQLRMAQFRVKRNKIDHIFITHLHGDHYYGLVGLISSYHLLKREKPLHVFGPAALQEIVELQLSHSETKLSFSLVFHKVDPNRFAVVFESDDVEVYSVPLYHRIPCCGYLFKEKPGRRHLIPEQLEYYNVPISFYSKLKAGHDFELPSGKVIPNEELTQESTPPRSYAFCTDTAWNIEVAERVKGVDLLYHEATFSSESESRAALTSHSTASQAADIASRAGAGALLLGHFSAKYRDLDTILAEAREVFENSWLATEGSTFKILKDHSLEVVTAQPGVNRV